MAIITKEDVKNFLGIAAAETSDDGIISSTIDRALAETELYCGRIFAEAVYTEYHDGDGSDSVLVDNFPIVSIASLHDDPDREYNADDLIDTDDYVFYANKGKIKLDGSVFSSGIKNIKIVYTAGYGGSIAYPNDLKQAMIDLTASIYLAGKAGINVVESQEIVYRPSYLKKEAYAILKRYRSIRT